MHSLLILVRAKIVEDGEGGERERIEGSRREKEKTHPRSERVDMNIVQLERSQSMKQ